MNEAKYSKSSAMAFVGRLLDLLWLSWKGQICLIKYIVPEKNVCTTYTLSRKLLIKLFILSSSLHLIEYLRKFYLSNLKAKANFKTLIFF